MVYEFDQIVYTYMDSTCTEMQFYPDANPEFAHPALAASQSKANENQQMLVIEKYNSM